MTTKNQTDKRKQQIRFELAKLLAPLNEMDYYRAFSLIDDLVLLGSEAELPKPSKKKIGLKRFVKLAGKVKKQYVDNIVDRIIDRTDEITDKELGIKENK